MSSRGSITLGELQGTLDLLKIKCHAVSGMAASVSCVSLTNMVRIPGCRILWQSLAGDCEHARSTAPHNRCAIYYPQLPPLFLGNKP
jgi:hypothetical protein